MSKHEEVFLDGLVSVSPVTIPKKKLPSTAKKDPSMNQYQVAQEIRLLAKNLSAPPPYITVSQGNLIAVLSTARASKEKRLAAAKEYTQAVNKYQEDVNRKIARIKELAQHLPTVPDLPTSNAENVLRAFVAILKSNGVIK